MLCAFPLLCVGGFILPVPSVHAEGVSFACLTPGICVWRCLTLATLYLGGVPSMAASPVGDVLLRRCLCLAMRLLGDAYAWRRPLLGNAYVWRRLTSLRVFVFYLFTP